MQINRSLQKKYFDLNKHQFTFENPKIIPNHIQEETNSIINILKKNNIKEVVDFGSGTGKLTIPLLKAGFKVYAVDISYYSLKKLLIYAKRINKDHHLTTVSKIPSNKKFRAIVGIDILHHIDIKKYFPIFYSSLTSDGFLVFLEPNCLNFIWYPLPFLILLFGVVVVLAGARLGILARFGIGWTVVGILVFVMIVVAKTIIDYPPEEMGIFQSYYSNLKNNLKKSGFKKINIKGFGLIPTKVFIRFLLLAKINYYLGNIKFLKNFFYRFLIEAYK